MRRVLVLGSGGAGKTTFASALAEVTGLPLVHLDRHYWGPGWQPTPAADWEAVVRDLIRRPAWIMDGSYGGNWIWTYPRRRRRQILERLEDLAADRSVHVLRSRREQADLLARIEKSLEP